MNVTAARNALIDAIAADGNPHARFRGARAFLRDQAAQAIGRPAGLPLADILSLAGNRPNTDGLRAFAVLLVHAMGVPGLVDTGFPAIIRFLERVLHHALRRAGYPFDGSTDHKRVSLERLHATIEEHMRPLEPSIPTWIPGNWP